MLKRAFDIVASSCGLIVFAPLLLVIATWVYLTDFHSPLYLSTRIGKGEKPFRLWKFRSMVPNAHQLGGDSTAADDKRITTAGAFLRKYKVDELLQLVNVLKGDMSLVGPRPNVGWAVAGYTPEEKMLVSIRPGITDFASIVFSDEGDILKGSSDPDGDYDRLIRPWKSRLGLEYVKHSSLAIDVQLVVLTLMAIFSRRLALLRVARLLNALNCDKELVIIARREAPLGVLTLPNQARAIAV
ncbi:MAG: sugar transferase [Bdellovibrionales bacterium]|nr:sugar transferase [Bdellovibrionales bacterium]